MTSLSKVAAACGVLLAAILQVGCASNAGAYGAAPASPIAFSTSAGAPSQSAPPQDYRIGPLDKLNITVFQVKDLTIEGVQVDGSGRISLPLIGSLLASGKTTQELSDEITGLLSGKYLQSPQVSVWVAEAVSQKVTVDGAVREPGVYAMSGPTTLLQAVAMAKGPDVKLANLSRVAVFRTVNGQRVAAVFDLKAIRSGKAPDPEIYGNDVIVVDGSAFKSAFREVIGVLPGLAIFRPY